MNYILKRGITVSFILMIGLLAITLLPRSVHSQNPAPQRIESDDASVTRAGSWTSQTASQASGGSYLYSSGADDDVLTLQFSGPSIEVIFVTGPSLGTLAINVDDIVLRTVITTADQTAYQQSSRIDYLSDEPHTLKVYAQAGGVVAIDAFVIPTPSPTPPLSGEGNADGETRDPFCAPTNQIHRVSLTSTGGQAMGRSYMGSLSNDGCYVAFFSLSSLVPADTYSGYDVYVYDRQTCTIELVSVSLTGGAGNNDSLLPSISGDGSRVVFYSYANNLVPNDTNGYNDIFVYDRPTHTMMLVSVASDGTQGTNDAYYYSGISNDGNVVAFLSRANNLVPGDTNYMDVFVHDLTTHTTTRVSVASDGTEGGVEPWSNPKLSADGRFITFSSDSPIFVPDDTNNHTDVFVHDRILHTTTRVSVGTGGTQGLGGESEIGYISSDGQFIAFASRATNLVSNDTNGRDDLFLHDRQANTTTRVSMTYDGGELNEGIFELFSISPDGRYIAFYSTASNLVVGDTNGGMDGFVYDRNTGITTRVTVRADGSQAQASADYIGLSLSADGRLVAFHSSSPDLISGDTNGTVDVFVAPVLPQVPTNLTATALDDGRIQLNWTDNTSDETDYRIERSPDGTNNWVEIGTVPVNTTTYTNVSLICGTTYHYRVRAYRASDMTYSAYSNVANATTTACPANCSVNAPIQRVSVSANGTQGNNTSGSSSLSTDGRFITFVSQATNLVPNDLNGMLDVFVKDRLTCQIWRVSIASNGTESNGASFVPDISGDGRYVVFTSESNNLVPNDTNACGSYFNGRCRDIFLHDRQTGQTSLISHNAAGQQFSLPAWNPVISANGQVVVYTVSVPWGLPSGLGDLLIYNRMTGTTDQRAYLAHLNPSISDDGRYVAFASDHNGLIPNDTNLCSISGNPPSACTDIFVLDIQTNTLERVSVSTNEAQSEGQSRLPTISGDGQYVAFVSDGDLVSGDTNQGTGAPADLFIRNRQRTITLRVNVSGGEIVSGLTIFSDQFSSDMHYLVFASAHATFVAGDTNNTHDIFVYDLNTGDVYRVNLGIGGVQTNAASLNPDFSGNGQMIAFESQATNLVAGDTNASSDLFLINFNPPASLALVNPATRSANLIRTLDNPPTINDYSQFTTGFPYGTGGQYVTGDWNGDGLDTLALYRNGAFFYTNDFGTGGTWVGIWFGLGGQPVVGRFDANVNHDCLGVTDSGTWTNGDTFFALYFTCNLTSGPTPPLTFQWLSILLPNSQGFTGTHQFVAGDFNGDGVDSVAVRRGAFIAWTNVPPTTLHSQFNLAQYIGAPGTGDEGKVVVGDWDLNQVDSFGLVYQNGTFYRRNDVEWNTGVYILQQFTPSVGTPFDVASWRPN